MAFAEEKKARGWGDNPIKDPYVVGAYIHLGNCFDLTDIAAVRQLPDLHRLVAEAFRVNDKALPENRSIKGEDLHDLVLRYLDCAVMNFAMAEFDRKAPQGRTHYYQTVRGVFLEGNPIYEGARIYEKTHIQVAVRDTSCIVRYFRPSG